MRAVEEPAGINNRQVGIGVIASQFVTFRPQPRDNAFGIDQRLRTAERNERDAGGPAHEKLWFCGSAPTRGTNWDHEPQRSSASRPSLNPGSSLNHMASGDSRLSRQGPAKRTEIVLPPAVQRHLRCRRSQPVAAPCASAPLRCCHRVVTDGADVLTTWW